MRKDRAHYSDEAYTANDGAARTFCVKGPEMVHMWLLSVGNASTTKSRFSSCGPSWPSQSHCRSHQAASAGTAGGAAAPSCAEASAAVLKSRCGRTVAKRWVRRWQAIMKSRSRSSTVVRARNCSAEGRHDGGAGGSCTMNVVASAAGVASSLTACSRGNGQSSRMRCAMRARSFGLGGGARNARK